MFDFLLRIVVVVVSKRCRLHVLPWKSTWESLVRQSQLLANTSIGSCSQLLPSIFLKKQDWTLRAGFEPAREIPLGFQVQRVNHSAITALLTLFIFWWNLIPSLDYFLLALLFAFLLRIVVLVFAKRCGLQLLSGKVIGSIWFVSLSCLRTQVLVRNPNFFGLYLWKMRSKAVRWARSCTGSSHWISSPTL